jgi:hypothetical protein
MGAVITSAFIVPEGSFTAPAASGTTTAPPSSSDPVNFTCVNP